MTTKREPYVVAYFGESGRIRTRRIMATSYGEISRLLGKYGIDHKRCYVSHIPRDTTYAQQREKVKQWLQLESQS
jgi:hypothetical protein